MKDFTDSKSQQEVTPITNQISMFTRLNIFLKKNGFSVKCQINSDLINQKKESGEFPLLVAYKTENLDIFVYLILKGANVDAWDNDYNRILHHIAKNTFNISEQLNVYFYWCLKSSGASMLVLDKDLKPPTQIARENKLTYFSSKSIDQYNSNQNEEAISEINYPKYLIKIIVNIRNILLMENILTTEENMDIGNMIGDTID